MDRRLLLPRLRETCFPWTLGAVPRPDRVGVEVEFLPRLADGAAVPLAQLVKRIAAHGVARGWSLGRTPLGDPLFHLPAGGTIGFEPGGQLEYSSPPAASVTELGGTTEEVLPPLFRALAEDGVRLDGVGLDPLGRVEDAPLLLRNERYLHMARYLAGRSPWGARMMRQTAAIHVNLDFGARGGDRWRVLNAAAPALTAIFANSSRMEGGDGGWRSLRSRAWRELDPERTGIFASAEDAADVYLAFALRAPLIARPDASGAYLPAARWLERGELDGATWNRHLTTLFPEIRPKGYFEIRTPDALPLEWCLVPAVVLVGLTYDDEALRTARELLPEPSAESLARAGRAGLRDPALARTAAELFDIALEGCGRLGPAEVDDRSLATARTFFERFTSRGRSPADEIGTRPLAETA